MSSAQAYATGMTHAYASAASEAESFAAGLGGCGVSGPAVAAVGRAQELTAQAGAAWAAADAALDQQHVVRDAYAAAPETGGKDFVTDGAAPGEPTSTEPGASGDNSSPEPVAPSAAGWARDEPAAEGAALATDPVVRGQREALGPVLAELLPALERARMLRQAMTDNATSDVTEIYDELADGDGDQMFEMMGKDIITLLDAVDAAAAAGGLGPAAEPGHTVAYDPDLHDVSGHEMGDATQVVVKWPGMTWRHGGDSKLIDKPWVVPYDDERGAHAYESIDSLSDVEERDDPVEVWIDPAKYPVPGAEDVKEPDYYTLAAATPCTADDADCDQYGKVPEGTECGSYWVEVEGYGDQCLHLSGDHKLAVADDIDVLS